MSQAREYATKEVLELLVGNKKDSVFRNINPHWWIWTAGKTFCIEYSYCGEIDCNCWTQDYLNGDEVATSYRSDKWTECELDKLPLIASRTQETRQRARENTKRDDGW